MFEGTEWETLQGLQLFPPTGLHPRLYKTHMDNIYVTATFELNEMGRPLYFSLDQS